MVTTASPFSWRRRHRHHILSSFPAIIIILFHRRRSRARRAPGAALRVQRPHERVHERVPHVSDVPARRSVLLHRCFLEATTPNRSSSLLPFGVLFSNPSSSLVVVVRNTPSSSSGVCFLVFFSFKKRFENDDEEARNCRRASPKVKRDEVTDLFSNFILLVNSIAQNKMCLLYYGFDARRRPRRQTIQLLLQRVQIFSVGLDQLSEQKVFLPLFQAENFQQVVHFFLRVLSAVAFSAELRRIAPAGKILFGVAQSLDNAGTFGIFEELGGSFRVRLVFESSFEEIGVPLRLRDLVDRLYAEAKDLSSSVFSRMMFDLSLISRSSW